MCMVGLTLRDKFKKYMPLHGQIYPKSHSSTLYKTVKLEYKLSQISLDWSKDKSKTPQVTRIYMYNGSTPTPPA